MREYNTIQYNTIQELYITEALFQSINTVIA